MKRDVGGGRVGEGGQKDESPFPLRCLVQGTQLERLPLFHSHPGVKVPRLQL